jgi:thioredoxin reductase (NADPH)
MKKHDFVIVGGGPGGYSAAIYAARYKMDVLVVGEIPGGIAGTAHDIRNYPGFSQISGMELMMKYMNQAKELGVPVMQTIVESVEKTPTGFLLKTKNDEILAKKVLIATGTARKELGIPREKEFIGRGVSYCATCDAGFYQDRVAGVVGGGDAALTAALLLSKYAKKVYVIYRKGEFLKAEVSWIQEIANTKNIEILFNEEVKEIIGEENLEKVKLSSGKEVELDGLFIEIGGTPNTKLAQELGVDLDQGSIIVDKNQETNVAGVFAAGDVTDRPFKQIISAAGDGATACYSAFKQIRAENAQIKVIQVEEKDSNQQNESKKKLQVKEKMKILTN